MPLRLASLFILCFVQLRAAQSSVQQDGVNLLQLGMRPKAYQYQESNSDVSTEDMLSILGALQDSLLRNPEFKKALNHGIKDLQKLVDSFSKRTKELDVGLVQLSNGIGKETFVPLLANYFNLTLNSQVNRDAEAARIYGSVETHMPKKLKVAVQPVVSLFFAGTNSTAPFDHAEFKSLPQEDLCGKTGPIIDYMENYHVNLTKVDTLLNTTKRILPILNLATPEAPKEVASFLQSMVELGVRETAARERSYTDLTNLVSPVVTDKLGCGVESDSSDDSSRLDLDRSSAVALFSNSAAVLLCQALLALL